MVASTITVIVVAAGAISAVPWSGSSSVTVVFRQRVSPSEVLAAVERANGRILWSNPTATCGRSSRTTASAHGTSTLTARSTSAVPSSGADASAQHPLLPLRRSTSSTAFKEKAITMSEGNQGPSWWFAVLGHTNTNKGMAVFLGILLTVVVLFGSVMWMLLP